jgi:hypothetical protein
LPKRGSRAIRYAVYAGAMQSRLDSIVRAGDGDEAGRVLRQSVRLEAEVDAGQRL